MNKSHFAQTILFSIFLFISANIASAANCTVTKTVDTNDGACAAGDCSLREAVAEASCSTIDFSLDLAGSTVGLTLGEIVIGRTVSINGYGAEALTISGNNISRIFSISTDAHLNLSGVKLTGGNGVGSGSGDGGAIRALGALNMNGVVLTQNTVCPGCRGSAFALASPAPLSVIRNSTIHDNLADAAVPAVSTDSGNLLVFYSSTIANNTGPGIFAMVSPVKVVQSTIAANGTGVILGGLGVLTVADSVVMDVCRCHNLTQFSSEGYNLVRSTAGSFPLSYQESDLVDTDPMLGQLGYNGGHTPTIAPFAGSPLIDGGSNALAASYSLTTDQRGYSRVFDGNGNGKATVDIGALELSAPAPAPVTVAGRVLGASGNPLRSQTVTITDMLGNSRTALSSSFGWFVFDNLPAGFVYRVSVKARRGTINRTIFAPQSLSDADIVIPGS